MKATKSTAALFILLLSSTLTFAQSTKDIFDMKKKIGWLGLDFSDAKFQGDKERFTSDTIVEKLITAWNNLMIKETEKYDVGKALHRPPLQNLIFVTMNHNADLNVSGIVDDNSKLFHFTKEDIARIVSSYDFGTLQDIGVMFIVESFSKLDNKGVVWVTYINLGSKEVIFTSRFIGKPGGFGLRNYWAGAIYDILRQMKSNYNSWSKKYK